MPQDAITPDSPTVDDLFDNYESLGADALFDNYDSPEMPSEPESENKPGLLMRAWEAGSKPLTDLPSRFVKPAAESLMQYGESGKGNLNKAALYGGAFLQSVGDVASGLTSPINLGMTAATAGTGAAARAGLPSIARGLNLGVKGLGAGMAVEGIRNAYQGETLPEKLMGGLEAVGGVMGIRERVPKIQPKPKGNISVLGLGDSTPLRDIARGEQYPLDFENEPAPYVPPIKPEPKQQPLDFSEPKLVEPVEPTIRPTEVTPDVIGEQPTKSYLDEQGEPVIEPELVKPIEGAPDELGQQNIDYRPGDETLPPNYVQSRNDLKNAVREWNESGKPPTGLDKIKELFHRFITEETGSVQLPGGGKKKQLTWDEMYNQQKAAEAKAAQKGVEPPKSRWTLAQLFNKAQREKSGDLPPSEMMPEFKSETAVDRLMKAIASHRDLREIQDEMDRATRSERFSKVQGIYANAKEGEGLSSFNKAAAAMRGEMEAAGSNKFKLNQQDLDTLFFIIAKNKRISTTEKFRAQIAMKKLVNPELGDGRPLQPNELALLDRVYGNGFANQIIQMHGGVKLSTNQLAKTANTMKTTSSAIDVSGPLRQGIGLAYRPEYYRAFKEMGKYLADETHFKEQMEALENRENFHLGRDSGLFLADHELTNFEEAFSDSYINDLRKEGKIGKLVTEPFAASERAYVGFLNKLRADTFDSMIAKADRIGLVTSIEKLDGAGNPYREPTIVAEKIAKYINTATGRGDLGALSKNAELLNAAFFSPRLIASRIQMMNPLWYTTLPKGMRMEALGSYVGLAGLMGTTYGLGYLLGGEQINPFNPKNWTNADLGKVKFGNTRVDPGAGFLQYMVAGSRFLNRLAAQTGGGHPLDTMQNFIEPNKYSKPQPRPVPYGQPSAGGGFAGLFQQQPSFLENKLSPMAGLIDTIISGRTNMDGHPISVPTEVAKRFAPMLTQDLWDLYQDDPDLFEPGKAARFGVMGSLGALGMGIQTYRPRTTGTSFRLPPLR